MKKEVRTMLVFVLGMIIVYVLMTFAKIYNAAMVMSDTNIEIEADKWERFSLVYLRRGKEGESKERETNLVIKDSMKDLRKKKSFKKMVGVIEFSIGLHTWYMCRMRKEINYCWHLAMQRVGVRREDSKKALGRMCKKDHLRSCMGLGHLEEEDGNLEAAEKFFNKSCKSGYAGGCWFGGKVRERQGDIVGAKDFYGRVCSEKIKLGCDAVERLDRQDSA